MIRSGMRERYVSEAMRHRDSRTTRRYTHLVSPDILGEIERVERAERVREERAENASVADGAESEAPPGVGEPQR